MTTRSAGSHTAAPLPHDPRWPRASEWLTEAPTPVMNPQLPPDLAILGVPTHLTSISPTQADTTPAAVGGRWRGTRCGRNRRAQTCANCCRLTSATWRIPTIPTAARPGDAGGRRLRRSGLLIALGGDNSLTYPVTRGLHATGLVTLDAHHDLRDGRSNGSPVARLITDGVIDPRRIVQVGLSDFANSPTTPRRLTTPGSRSSPEARSSRPASWRQ